MVRNVDSPLKFLMYLRFLQLMINEQVDDLSAHNIKYTSPALTQKVFTNMKRIGKGFLGADTPLFDGMLVPQQVQDVEDAAEDEDDVNEVSAEPTLPSPTPDTDEAEPAEVKEVIEVVTAAKLMTEVVTTVATPITATQVPKTSAPRRRRGTQKRQPLHQLLCILKLGPKIKARARKNMMIYLKNMAGFKMDFFKRMTYKEIRPIFKKHYNLNQAFLERVEEEVTCQKEEGSKRKDVSLEQRAAKKQIIDEEVEEFKTHLQIVANDDDDVYTKATPLALKVPIVDYQIHHEHNKPYYKIIRVDETHQLFISFITLLKKFDREDLDMLWKLVQERFQSSEPKNFSNDFLLNTLKIMFEKPNMILLVENKYPLTRFTLEQMLNNVRLKVEEESEMSLELLRISYRVSIRSDTDCEGPCRLAPTEMKELLEYLQELQDFPDLSKIDLYSGCHQMRVHEDEIPKTTFTMHYGRYEFTAMPFWVDQCTNDFHGRGAQVTFKDEFGATEEREVSCEAQQGRSGVKSKIFGSCRNNMGNELILALPEGSNNFIVMREARVRMRADVSQQIIYSKVK
nr:reverse transcriptase [Tanacetum cinerariifolium]